MGGIIGLCTPDGGPCGGKNEDTSERQNMERMRLIAQNITPESTSSSESSKTMSREPTISEFQMPTKKIRCPPIISKYILKKETFTNIRKQMEDRAVRKYRNEINQIVFQDDCWLIQGVDSIALEDHRELFEIVIWRIPIIPALAHFDDESKFYAKLDIAGSSTNINKDGIWSILPKQKFVREFGQELLTDIDLINDETHKYLADPDKLPANTDEFATLIEKLKVIEKMKQKHEILIIGQKACVQDILRVIRRCEVEHPSMAGMFDLGRNASDWSRIDCVCEPKCPDPDPNVIANYYCIVSNVPMHATEEDVDTMLSKYERWTDYKLMDTDHEQPQTTLGNSVSEEDENKDASLFSSIATGPSYKFAKIMFDNCQSLKMFVDDVQKDSVYLAGNNVSLHKQNKEFPKRKERRLYRGYIIV
eukprot:CAMPEP_0197053146 /NCGR_PEP_ID=MMETSP1384-20130603/27481_1 /TAXON_ID=29189 /ORGANISM="Ammonia sp." /LENGTH=419 /DNA_ID=CAMNT_0042485995 /DNA_START=1 /DNA_END=1260 /DNA_ORIENTATION=-